MKRFRQILRYWLIWRLGCSADLQDRYIAARHPEINKGWAVWDRVDQKFVNSMFRSKSDAVRREGQLNYRKWDRGD